MRITAVTSNYPSRSRPSCGAFVRETIRAFSRHGAQCTVICPTSFADLRYGKLDATETTESVNNGSPIHVLRPRHVTASSKNLLIFNTGAISDACFGLAASRALAGLQDPTDVLYGHFLYPSGRVVARLGERCGIPAFVAHGDGRIDEDWYLDRCGVDFRNIAGVIAVSRPNARFSENVLHVPPERVGYFPNGVDLGLFFPRNRTEMRSRLGLPLDKRIAVFVGHFIELKGPDRVLRAIEGIKDVQVLMMGSGPMRLKSPRISFMGEVAHSVLPDYLSAADLFILPTVSEGCCNSTLEAMACGLPVVSSVGEFNDDILNENVSLRVDPLDIDAIREAARSLLDNESLRAQMSENCLIHAQRFSVDRRAQGILEWMSSLVSRRPATQAAAEAPR